RTDRHPPGRRLARRPRGDPRRHRRRRDRPSLRRGRAGRGPLELTMPIATPPPYRSGLATGFGVVLAAGAALGVVDVVHTGGDGHPAPPLLALWALIALPMAVGVGLVLGAGNATWGDRWVRRAFRRLRHDAPLDRAIAA